MKTVQYSSTRLTFKKSEIEPLRLDDIIIIKTPKGTYQMTKADFYNVFGNVVQTRSYQEHGSYNYPATPQKANRFLVAKRY